MSISRRGFLGSVLAVAGISAGVRPAPASGGVVANFGAAMVTGEAGPEMIVPVGPDGGYLVPDHIARELRAMWMTPDEIRAAECSIDMNSVTDGCTRDRLETADSSEYFGGVEQPGSSSGS